MTVYYKVRRAFFLFFVLLPITAIWGETKAQAQNKFPLPHTLPKVTYGVVPDSILKMKSYPPDPNANYLYVFKGVNITFQEDKGSLIAILNYHIRIKILTQKGKKASIVDIPYYFKNGIEKIKYVRGETIHPNGSRIILDTSHIHTIGVNGRYKLKEFTFPAVTVGSVLDYTYTIERRYIEELPDFYFMNTQPTLYARIRLINSQYVRYYAMPVNMSKPPHLITQKIDTSSVPKIFTFRQPPPVLIDNWYEFNVPALREEPYITSLNDYRWKMKFLWKSFGDPRQVLEKSWKIVAAEIHQQTGLEDNMKKYKEIEKIGHKYISSVPNVKARIDSVFRYLNNRVTYNGNTGVFSNMNLNEVLKGQPANQSAINQTLILLLRGAGFKANPLLLSTRNYGKILNDFPSIYQFNGMIAYCKADGKEYFLDATQKNSIPNLLPTKLINGSGMLLKKDSYKWITVSPDRSKFSMKVDLTGRLDKDGNLTGSIKAVQYGYLAQKIRNQKNTDMSNYDIVHEDLLGRYTQPTINHISFENLNDLEKPVVVKTDFKIPQYAVSFESGLEFSPLIIGYQMQNPLGSDNRSLPVTLQAKENLNAHFSIRMPKGYRLRHRQDRAAMKIPGARLSFHYSSKGDILTYDFDVEVLKKNFGEDLFPQLISMYSKWVELSRTRLFIHKQK